MSCGTKSQLGSDIIKYNPKIKVIDDPYTGRPVSMVPASRSDVAVIYAARADEIGNVQCLGLYGNTDTLAWAAKHFIVSLEEIITSAEIRRMPNLTTIPYYYVDAIVHSFLALTGGNQPTIIVMTCLMASMFTGNLLPRKIMKLGQISTCMGPKTGMNIAS